MSPNEVFAAAHSALQRADYDLCETYLAQLAAAVGEHDATEHLAALACKGRKDYGRSLAHFDRAIELAAAAPDPFVLANRADVLGLAGRAEEALAASGEALRLFPQNAQLQDNHLLLLHRYGGEEAADEEYRRLLDLAPGDHSLWHRYALFLRETGRINDAAAAITEAMRLNPQSQRARLLATHLALDAGTGDVDAIAPLALAAQAEPEYGFAYVASLVRKDRWQDAIGHLDQRIAQADGSPDTFCALRVDLTHEFEGPAAARKFIDLMVEKYPADPLIAIRRLNYIWRTEGGSAALTALDSVDGRKGDPLFDVMRAELLSTVGETGEADRLYAAMATYFDAAPAETAMARVRHQFRSGRPEEAGDAALSLAERYGLVEAWAHVELAWRVTGDRRWDWLTRSGTLVQYEPLGRFDAYREDLVALLRKMHGGIGYHPLQQSPRNGTQSDGNFLSIQQDVVRALRSDILKAVDRYRSEFIDPIDAAHPLSRLAHASPKIAGSWSVRLLKGGFHTPHFHNQGILSSACHVSLPADSDGAGQGVLEFGSAPENLGQDIEPFFEVEPKEGHFGLFPSFYLHAVRPYGDGERLVVACDIASV